MNTPFHLAIGILLLMTSVSKSDPASYLYSNARMKYRSVEGVNVKMNDRLTLVLWRADWYRHFPISQNGGSEWWGYDFSPGLTYKLWNWGPVSTSAGLNELIIMRFPIVREHRERANLNLNYTFGFLSLGMTGTVEHRQYNTDLQFEKYRGRLLFKAGVSKGFTRMQISPFATWEMFDQKRDSLDVFLGDAYKYREAEVGVIAKLSEKVSIGLADMFEYFPTQANIRGEFSSHRFSTNFYYTVDLSKK
jgi:hypothetical protein